MCSSSSLNVEIHSPESLLCFKGNTQVNVTRTTYILKVTAVIEESVVFLCDGYDVTSLLYTYTNTARLPYVYVEKNNKPQSSKKISLEYTHNIYPMYTYMATSCYIHVHTGQRGF